MTAQDAAEASRARDGKGVSGAYWRDVERGYGGRRGERVPTRASARALAAMARTVGVRPAQLTQAGRQDAAGVLEEILRREDLPSRRDVPFHDGGDDAALRPFVEQIREQAYAALVDLFGDALPAPDDPDVEAAMAALPGASVFPGEDRLSQAEARSWDRPNYSLREKLTVLAATRKLAAKINDAERRRTGLITAGTTGYRGGAGAAARASSWIPSRISVGGKALRASS